MVVTDSGRKNEVKDEQPSKAIFLMQVIELGRSIFVRAEQPLKVE
jgi:hypothetical protein